MDDGWGGGAAVDGKARLVVVGYTVQVSDLTWPLTISHRGGAGIYPENSWEAKTASVSSGFLPEFDLRTLADGRTLVSCHDETVDRTMTNIGPGAVSSKTVPEWRRARVAPSIAGGHEGRPLLWDEVLDTWGGRVVLVPELKEPAAVPTFLDGVSRRGLQQSVIAQTFSWSAARQLAAAGLTTLYLSSECPDQTPAAIRNAGIALVGADLDRWTAAEVRAMQAAGLRTLGFTVETLGQARTPLALTCDGLFSNDAWATTESIPVRSGDPFGEGIRPYGMGLPYTVADGVAVPMPSPPIRLVGPALGFTQPTPAVAYAPQPWAGTHLRPPVRVAMTLHFGASRAADEVSQADGLGFVLHAHHNSRSAHDPGAAGPALSFLVQRDGRLSVWSWARARPPTQLGSSPHRPRGSAAFAPAGRESVVDLVVQWERDGVTMTADSRSRGEGFLPAQHLRVPSVPGYPQDLGLTLRWPASRVGPAGLISAVSVALLP